jgi:DNA-binding transcriptional LysR family regulator
MELRHLRYFVAVADSLHFGQAAAALHIAQPSLSDQIRRLEDELKTALLRRTKRRVELTDAGRVFLDDARDIIARADRAAMTAQRAGRGFEGRLRVGVGYCMDQARISEVVSAFNVRHPAVCVELQTLAVPAQLKALQSQSLDVGFVRPPVTELDLAGETLSSEALIAALPARHRLASRTTIALSALTNDPFILVPRDLVPVYHDIVLSACRQAGFVPHSPHEADHLNMILAMVGGGSGVALVPAFARRLKPPRVAFVSLQPPTAPLDVLVAWRHDNASPALKEFLDVARRQIGAGAPRRAEVSATRRGGRGAGTRARGRRRPA